MHQTCGARKADLRKTLDLIHLQGVECLQRRLQLSLGLLGFLLRMRQLLLLRLNLLLLQSHPPLHARLTLSILQLQKVGMVPCNSQEKPQPFPAASKVVSRA